MSTHAQPAPELPEDTGYVCSCLRITECQLLATLARTEIQTLRDLRRATGAGDGCTACHQTLKKYLKPNNRPTREAGGPVKEVADAGTYFNARV
mgnify:CR=1 FL=1